MMIRVVSMWLLAFITCALPLLPQQQQLQPIKTRAVFDFIEKQSVRTALSITPNASAACFPAATRMDVPSGTLNTWELSTASSWTSGFFAGVLWQLYANSDGNQTLKELAVRWTEPLRQLQNDINTHDVGFMVFDSFGKGVELGGMGSDYEAVVLHTAHSLATRFSSRVGCTQSWSSGKHCREHPSLVTNFPVIIDNMMNLELLFWAANKSGNATLAAIAASHAKKTAQNHVRLDGSTFHVVDYDPNTGAVVTRCTNQGYHDNSTWSRGQSWCVYGFTMAHRFQKDPVFLATAEKCADFFLSKLGLALTPSDGIPLWDFNWDGPDGYHDRDASAAAIAASGLLELAQVASSSDKQQQYQAAAMKLLSTLTSSYLGDLQHTQGVLLHATASFVPNSSVDVSLVYGGYYLLEALRRAQRLGLLPHEEREL